VGDCQSSFNAACGVEHYTFFQGIFSARCTGIFNVRDFCVFLFVGGFKIVPNMTHQSLVFHLVYGENYLFLSLLMKKKKPVILDFWIFYDNRRKSRFPCRLK
jgi:hypothetical protein